ncbi:MAG: glycosyltransferase family 2 protein [Pirellulaceae bacterium]
MCNESIGVGVSQPLLSIVIPVFNERNTLPEVIAAVEALPVTKQIVIVDDASTDGTTQWLQTLRGRDSITVVLRRRNRGKGSALRLAFRHCRGDIVAIQDADLEYHPQDLLKVIRPIVDGLTDIAYGSRYLGETVRDPSSLHRLGNRLLTGLSNLTTGLRLTDMETCYKAFRREVIQSLPLRQCRFGFEPEVTAKLARRGHSILEVSINYNSRGYDEGKKIGWKDAVNAVYCMIRYCR